MERRFEPVDLMVAVGVFATIVGAYTFFMAANGQIVGTARETVEGGQPSDVMAAMQWVQPALGEAIVEGAVLNRNAAIEIQSATFKLIQAMGSAEQLQRSRHWDIMIGRAAEAESEQAGRVQYVLGRMIVNVTGRGMSFSPEGIFDNRRLIDNAVALETRMNQEFVTHRQGNLGHGIVALSLEHMRSVGQNQQRLGKALVNVAQAQETSKEAKAAERQVATAALAALNTESLHSRLVQVAEAEPTSEAEAPFVGPRTLPEIPLSILAVGSAVAVGIFLVGLILPARKGPEEGFDTETPRRYRKAV